MRRWTMFAAPFAALFAGCYRPALEDACTVACPEGFCPNGMECGSDSMCHLLGTADCSALGDARNDDGDGGDEICLGNGFIKNYCFKRPLVPLTFGAGSTFNTNGAACSDTRVEPDGTTLCFLIGTRIMIDGVFRANGQNPLVLVGVDEIVIAATGVLDVSSRSADLVAGAGGGEAKGCAPSIAIGGANDAMQVGGGGGAGGSLTARGGNGGGGFNGIATIAGGTAAGEVVITSVRGGCPGGIGGNGGNGSSGIGAYGGGAVYLMSQAMITVDGRINASGAGGGQPKMTGGAGGGGTGGFIGLDAQTYMFANNAAIYAVGGSGGAGASPAAAGIAGKEATGPTSPGPTTTAGSGGVGGAGGAMMGGGAGASASSGGGGGGGGSMGYIGMATTLVIPIGVFAPSPMLMN